MTTDLQPPAQEIPLPLQQTGHNLAIYRLLQQMQSRQWWSPARLRRQQLQDAATLFRYARQYSPFYAERLQSLDLQAVNEDALRSIPLLTRQELREYRADITCRQIPEAHGKTIQYTTSGSTGTPVVVDGTALTSVIWSAVTLRDHLWQQRDHRLLNAAIRWQADDSAMAPDGLQVADWGAPFAQFYDTGPACLLNSSSALEDQLAWLRARDPHYLITHPSNLAGLLHAAGDSGLGLTRIRELRTVGETLDDSTRELAQQRVGVPVIDFYTSQETGYIALQCPEYQRYHIQAEHLLVEVLDESGQACPPGTPGRVVITSLSNYAMPLIRYEIGDYAEPGESCVCGRGLPVLNRVLGRVRNLFTHADGNRSWPNFGMRNMLNILPVRQFQVVQHELKRLELRMVVDTAPSADQEQAVKTSLAQHLRFTGEIEISYHSALMRSAGGKFEDFLSLLPAP